MIFKKPSYVKASLSSLDEVMRASMSDGGRLIESNPFLRNLSTRCDSGSFCYFLIVAAVDLIYTKSIITFGPGSSESKKVAAELRKAFESKINNHLMNNLAGLHDFTSDSSIHLDHGMLPSDLHGAWVVMAYEGSMSLGFSTPDVQVASRAVSDWLESHTQDSL